MRVQLLSWLPGVRGAVPGRPRGAEPGPAERHGTPCAHGPAWRVNGAIWNSATNELGQGVGSDERLGRRQLKASSGEDSLQGKNKDLPE